MGSKYLIGHMGRRVAALALLIFLSSVASSQVFLAEDFERADGPVGNGWTTWWAGNLPDDSETRIVNGALRAPGAFHQEGGIFRDGVTLPSEFFFQFDFKTDAPADGGFDIRFGAGAVAPNTPADVFSFPSAFRFIMFAGDRFVRRVTSRNGGNVLEDLPVDPGQRRFGNQWATIQGHVFADRSSSLTIIYRDQFQPEEVTVSFPAFNDPLEVGDRFALSNSNQTYGPHWFDNLIVSSQPVPEPATMAVLGVGLIVVGMRRKR